MYSTRSFTDTCTFTVASADHFVFHSPYCKLVQKSLARLLLNDFLTQQGSMINDNQQLEQFRWDGFSLMWNEIYILVGRVYMQVGRNLHSGGTNSHSGWTSLHSDEMSLNSGETKFAFWWDDFTLR